MIRYESYAIANHKGIPDWKITAFRVGTPFRDVLY